MALSPLKFIRERACLHALWERATFGTRSPCTQLPQIIAFSPSGSANGSYAEGPQFSTRAESHMYRSWGGTVINMSTLPEAKLAAEAEIAYQVILMSTDYDVRITLGPSPLLCPFLFHFADASSLTRPSAGMIQTNPSPSKWLWATCAPTPSTPAASSPPCSTSSPRRNTSSSSRRSILRGRGSLGSRRILRGEGRRHWRN